MFIARTFAVATFLALALPACSAADAPNSESSSAVIRAKNFDSKLEIDLQAFRAHAEKKLKESTGVDVTNGHLFFMDGYAAVSEAGILADHAAIYYIADIPESLQPEPGLRIAYRMVLSGVEEVLFISPGEVTQLSALLRPLSAAVAFKESASPEAASAHVEEVKRQHPSLRYTFRPILLFAGIDGTGDQKSLDGVSIPEFVNAYRKLQASDLVQVSQVSLYNYKMPFGFDAPIDLGVGAAPEKKDLNALRNITKRQIEEGYGFTTLPSLPPPFGPGETPNPELDEPSPGLGTASRFVVVREDADFAQCRDAIAQKVKVVQELASVKLVGVTATEEQAVELKAIPCVQDVLEDTSRSAPASR